MYVISGSTCASTLSSTLLTILCLTDNEHRVRNERLTQRRKEPGILEKVLNSLESVFILLRGTRNDVESNSVDVFPEGHSATRTSQYGAT